MYVEYVYNLIKKESEGMDAIYEDYICHLIGVKGLEVLQMCKLIETCGVVNGRQLYTLCEKKW